MTASVDFYFDFSSSYSYLALPGIDRLTRERNVEFDWKPIALGAIFKARQHAPPAPGSSKGDYVWRDVARTAEINEQPYHWPEPFPFNSIAAARIYWHLAAIDTDNAVPWARAVFHASYGEGRDCSSPEVLAAVAQGLGLDSDALLEATGDDSVKTKLKEVTGEAMERGVFGAPTFCVGDEMFWGGDRLQQLERFLK